LVDPGKKPFNQNLVSINSHYDLIYLITMSYSYIQAVNLFLHLGSDFYLGTKSHQQIRRAN